MIEARGALARILFNDGQEVEGYYISFSNPPRIDEEARTFDFRDKWGMDDDQIFYYAPDGESELKELSNPNEYNDFRVLDYQLIYEDVRP